MFKKPETQNTETKNTEPRNPGVEKAYLPITTFTVERCRVNSTYTMIRFTLKIPGAIFPDMKCISTDKGEFLAPPADKGPDGKYYKRYYVYFSPEDTERIMAEVERQLEKQEKGEK